jgi:hypothetical protein
MTLPKNVAELQGENVLFELECIDRMYLNLYVPQLASAPGVAAYFRGYKGHRFASTKEAVAMSEGFRRQVLNFAERKATPIIRFEKGMRKDDVMHNVWRWNYGLATRLSWIFIVSSAATTTVRALANLPID